MAVKGAFRGGKEEGALLWRSERPYKRDESRRWREVVCGPRFSFLGSTESSAAHGTVSTCTASCDKRSFMVSICRSERATVSESGRDRISTYLRIDRIISSLQLMSEIRARTSCGTAFHVAPPRPRLLAMRPRASSRQSSSKRLVLVKKSALSSAERSAMVASAGKANSIGEEDEEAEESLSLLLLLLLLLCLAAVSGGSKLCCAATASNTMRAAASPNPARRFSMSIRL